MYPQVWRAGLSGLLVGWGASMANGCTSGHGICGNARLSPRSMVYTLTFMVAGAAAAYLTNSPVALGIASQPALFKAMTGAELKQALAILGGSVAALTALAGISAMRASPNAAASSSGTGSSSSGRSAQPAWELLAEAAIGVVFALGLGLSGMTQASKVVGFLSVTHPAWDVSLMGVMGGAILIAAIGYQWIVKHRWVGLGLLPHCWTPHKLWCRCTENPYLCNDSNACMLRHIHLHEWAMSSAHTTCCVAVGCDMASTAVQ